MTNSIQTAQMDQRIILDVHFSEPIFGEMMDEIMLLIFNEAFAHYGVSIEINQSGFLFSFESYDIFDHLIKNHRLSIPTSHTSSENTPFKMQISLGIPPVGVKSDDIIEKLISVFSVMNIPTNEIIGTGIYECIYPGKEAFIATLFEAMALSTNQE